MADAPSEGTPDRAPDGGAGTVAPPPQPRSDGARASSTEAAARNGSADGARANGAGGKQKLNLQPAEPPRLAKGVELIGEMKESGFEEEPFLISVNGQYAQVPCLLYQVVEEIDGKRSSAEIAKEVAGDEQVVIDPPQMKEVLTRLVAMGVIVNSEGMVIRMKNAGGYSPLKLGAKMKMLGPGAITPVTAVLKLLFWPPIVLAVIAAAIFAHWWMYFQHGMGDAVRDVFLMPGYIIVILGLIVVSAVAHEFGHAAGMHYGGGRVRGMGAGIYMVYPAFYTDVTDAYRLGKWGRFRTDAGGLYFNLIFATALVGLTMLTGAEIFLVAVALLNIEMIHQLLPLGRMDGYWALADLVGVPDFFSRIMPFLRSIAPGPLRARMGEGPELPPLKRHARVMFFVYIITIIPLLIFLLFLMLRAVPRLIATAWTGIEEQAAILRDAWNAGDLLTAGGSALQIGIVGLMLFGIGYFLVQTFWKLGGALVRWSKPTPARRVTGTLVGAGVAALLAYLWLPQISLPGRGGDAPLYETARTRFEPIAEGERFSLPDAAAARVVFEDPADEQRAGDDDGAAADDGTPTADETADASSGASTPAAGGGTDETPEATSTPARAATSTPVPEDTPVVEPTAVATQ